MGTTLTGTTPQDTYDSLIKVTDNGPLSGTLKALSDGLGNDSTLSLSTTAASIAGTLAVTGNATFDTNTLFVDAASNEVGIGTSAPIGKLHLVGGVVSTALDVPSDTSVGQIQFGFDSVNDVGTIRTFASKPIMFSTAGAERMRITSAGNVGIGTSTAAQRLDISSGALITTRIDSDLTCFDTQGLIYTRTNNIGSIDGLRYASRSHRFVSHANTVYATIDADGLKFGSDTLQVNALDDYEEGTFTPILAFGGTGISTYNAQKGFYTKIGNTVNFTVFIQVREKGAGTGAVTVSIPLASVNTQDRSYSINVTGQSLSGLSGALFGYLVENSSSVQVFQTDATGGTALTDAVFNDFSTDNIIVTGTYQTA